MHPVLWSFGPVHLYSYGMMLAIGFLAAMAVAERRAQAAGLDPHRIQTLGLLALAAGLLGARIGYVLLNLPLFLDHPGEIFRVDHGGLVFYAGFAAGIIAGILYILKAKLPLGVTLDLMIPSVVLAHAFGRVGCFLNGCCYGKPSSLPWAVVFPGDVVARHPTQLYEAAALVAIFFFLRRVARRSAPPGTVVLVYGLAYGTWRFFVEFLRGDNPIVGGGLTMFQWWSIALVLVCGLILPFRRR